MSDLEAEFGRDRFARFWTSDQSVEDAFAAAFDEPIGAWTMRWAQDRMGPQKSGSIHRPPVRAPDPRHAAGMCRNCHGNRDKEASVTPTSAPRPSPRPEPAPRTGRSSP